MKQLTALALTRVKGEEAVRIAKRGDYRGANDREGANERERERKKERERGRDKENERALVPRGRDSIKRTHINESFQGKTELYAGASISTCVRRACTYTHKLTRAYPDHSRCRERTMESVVYIGEYPGMCSRRRTLIRKDSFG